MEQKLSYIKSLRVLHSALLAGQLLFLGIGFYIAYAKTIAPIAVTAQVLLVLKIVLGAAGVLCYAGFYLYRVKIRKLSESSPGTAEKLNDYRAANLIRWAMLEAPVLLLIIAGMLTGANTVFIAALLIIIIFILTAPAKNKITAETGFTDEEVDGPL